MRERSLTNFVLIMTDSQRCAMVGAYGGGSFVDTPHLDRLADEGLLFRRAYTSSPLCTPARGAIFTGQYPQVNGAWANNMAPSRAVPMIGTIFGAFGYEVAYTGKWHLDGTGYFGDGEPGGGFAPDWWYDGKRYLDEIGPAMARAYQHSRSSDDLRAAGFDEDHIWAHRVAGRAVDFLDEAGDRPFVLVVSFDEPHGPYVAPPDWWDKYVPEDLPEPPNLNAPLHGKPQLQQVQRRDFGDFPWPPDARFAHYYACNAYVDREIGRVVDAVNRRHRDTTTVMYTSDHGDQFGAHGLRYKGPMMYEESCRVPFIVRSPEGPIGATIDTPVSHLDILPTMLDLAGLECPPSLHGASFADLLKARAATHRDHAFVSFHRFAVNHDSFGEFYPIRCVVSGGFKLAINLFDTDELYDLTEDAYEMTNLVNETDYRKVAAELHDVLLDEMDRVRDPFRSFHWGDRTWRRARHASYCTDVNRPRPAGFSFEPTSFDG